jgi:hypothetical protein
MADAVDPSAGWYVHLSVSDAEGRALLAAAGTIAGERGASLVVSPSSDLRELVLFSREDEEERARDEVVEPTSGSGASPVSTLGRHASPRLRGHRPSANPGSGSTSCSCARQTAS